MTLMLTDLEREWELLGAMVLRPAVIPDVMRYVEVGDFAHAVTQQTWEALERLYLSGAVPDAFLLRDELANPKLALQVVEAMREATVVPANAVFHAKRLRSLSMLRTLRAIGSEFADLDPNDDPATTIARAADRLRAAGEEVPGGWMGPAELVALAEKSIDEHSASESIIRTKLPTLDDWLDGGLVPQRLYTVGAKTSVGKSALATSIARPALDAGQRVMFVSLEMSGPEVIQRMVAEKYDIGHHQLGRLIEAWNSPEVLAWPLSFMGFANISTLCVTARQLKPQGLRLIIVDYIQLLPSVGQHERRDLEIGYMTRTLKLLAVELEVPVLMLSQVNRDAGPESPPQLHNLRESGNLEQDSNVVLLLHRVPNDPDKHREAQLAVAKNRHGTSGIIELAYTPERTRFREMDGGYHG